MSSASNASLASQLAQFRRLYVPRTERVADIAFSYLVIGQGSTTIAILPGLLGVAELSFQIATLLGAEHRVIVLSWPGATDTVDQLTAGIAGILDREGVRQAAIVGSSFGGLVAQRFALRYPDRVSQLILADTSVPRPERAAANRRAARLIAILPARLLRWLLRQLSLRAIGGGEAGGFWTQYLDEAVAGVSAAELAARYRVAADFDAGPALNGQGLARPVLLIESDDDPIVTQAATQALRAAFPTAATHVFHRGGHAPAILCPDDYARAIASFVAHP